MTKTCFTIDASVSVPAALTPPLPPPPKTTRKCYCFARIQKINRVCSTQLKVVYPCWQNERVLVSASGRRFFLFQRGGRGVTQNKPGSFFATELVSSCSTLAVVIEAPLPPEFRYPGTLCERGSILVVAQSVGRSSNDSYYAPPGALL